MEDKFFLAGAAGIGIKFLGVFAGAERAKSDCLRFTALEQGRTVRARQDAHFAVNRANG